MTTVIPVEPIFDDENFTFTLADVTGVNYAVNGLLGYEPGTYDIADIHNGQVVEVAATPGTGYSFDGEQSRTWMHVYEGMSMILNPPAAPQWIESEFDSEDAVIIPDSETVDYWLDTEMVPAGEYEVTYGGPMYVSAYPKRGYYWSDPSFVTQWNYTFTSTGQTALIPAFPTKPETSNSNGIPSFTIPYIEGVQYIVNETVYEQGTYIGQSYLDIVAEPLPGYTIDGVDSHWVVGFPQSTPTPPVQSLSFYAVLTKTGVVQGQLPLVLDGDMTHLMHDFGTAQFFLPTTDPSCPDNWEELIKQQKMSIVVQDDSTGLVIWEGRITSKSRETDGGVSFPCVSAAMYLSQRHVQDISSRNLDQADWVKLLVSEMEKGGVGIGLKTNCPLTGIKRTTKFNQYENKTFFAAINELAQMENGFEWTIDVAWKDANKTAVTRTLRTGFPFIGNNAPDTASLVFDLPGNILKFEASEPMGADEFATSVVVTGDGSGVKQVRSNPKISTALEQAGQIPRIEVIKSFNGIAYNNDAEVMAAGISGTYYSPQWTLTVTLAGDEVRLGDNLHLGDAVTVYIDTDDLKINGEVWRVVAVTIAADGTVSPVLSPNVAGSGKFPRIPGDPTNLTRDLRDVKDEAKKITNPFAKGIQFDPGTDGYSYGFEPDGSFGKYSPDGSFDSIYDPSTGEFGSNYGVVDKATVSKLGTDSTVTATARTDDGKNISVLDWTGLGDLKVGDQVSVAQNRSGSYSMLTRIRRMNYEQTAFNYSYHIMDSNAQWSDDEGSILSFYPSGYNSWSPVTRKFSDLHGSKESVGRRCMYQGKMFSMNSESDGTVHVYRVDPTAGPTEEYITDIGQFTIRQGHFFQNEVYSRPRTIELLPSTAQLVPDGDSYAVKALATIRTWDETTKDWIVSDIELRSGAYVYEWTGSGEPPEDPGPVGSPVTLEIIYSISGEGHMFVEVEAFESGPALGDFKKGLLLFKDSAPTEMEFVSGDGIEGYMEFEPGMLATQSLDFVYGGVRLSSDGALYFARASSGSWLNPQVIMKKLGGAVEKIPFSSGTYLQPEATTAVSPVRYYNGNPITRDVTMVQRAGLTNTFYVSSHIYSGDSPDVPLRAAVIKCNNGSNTFLQEPGLIAERNGTNTDAYLGDPLESPDGTFMVVMDNAAQRSTWVTDYFNQKVVIYVPE